MTTTVIRQQSGCFQTHIPTIRIKPPDQTPLVAPLLGQRPRRHPPAGEENLQHITTTPC